MFPARIFAVKSDPLLAIREIKPKTFRKPLESHNFKKVLADKRLGKIQKNLRW